MHHLTRTAALLGGLLIGTLAHADIVNGNFATGLNGWQTFGDAAALSASPSGLALPLTGNTLVLSTATLGSDDFPFADGHYNVSGQEAGLAGVPGGLEAFVGTTPGALDPDTIDHTSFLWEGSAAKQTFTVQAGDTLRFDWNLLSADRDFADSAFAVLQSGTGLQVLSLADALQASQAVAGNTDLLQTGAHQFSHTFAQAGTVMLSLAVADLQAGDKTTLLAVNNVQVVAAVPEPDSMALALLALGAFGAGLLRRQRRG